MKNEFIAINKKDIKIRRSWNINPKTRIVESRKKYERAKNKREFYKEIQESE